MPKVGLHGTGDNQNSMYSKYDFFASFCFFLQFFVVDFLVLIFCCGVTGDVARWYLVFTAYDLFAFFF